jgi:hypothetical protein
MIQKVWAVIQVGMDEDNCMYYTPITGPEDIPDKSTWRNEKEIAKALRRLAKEIETGASFHAFEMGA